MRSLVGLDIKLIHYSDDRFSAFSQLRLFHRPQDSRHFGHPASTRSGRLPRWLERGLLPHGIEKEIVTLDFNTARINHPIKAIFNDGFTEDSISGDSGTVVNQ